MRSTSFDSQLPPNPGVLGFQRRVALPKSIQEYTDGLDSGDGDVRAFRWVPASDTLMALPKGDQTTTEGASSAFGVSSDGEYMAGVIANSEGVHATRWNAALEAVSLPNPSHTEFVALNISGDGTTVVGVHDPAALIWKVGDPYGTDITSHGSFYLQYFLAVSGDGKIAVGIGGIWGEGDHPIWWSSDTGIVELAGTTGEARNISSDGTVIVGQSAAVPTRWTGPGFTTREPLPLLPNLAVAPKGWINATSRDGSVSVGASQTTDTYGEAALWTDGRVQKISDILTAAGADLFGWTLDEAVGISDDGKIVLGKGRYGGRFRAWIVGLP